MAWACNIVTYIVILCNDYYIYFINLIFREHSTLNKEHLNMEHFADRMPILNINIKCTSSKCECVGQKLTGATIT